MTCSTPVYKKKQVHAIAPTIRDWLLILHHCIIHEPAIKIHAKVRMSAQSHFVWIMDRWERSWLCRNFSLVYHIRNTCLNLNGAYQGRNPLVSAKAILSPYWLQPQFDVCFLFPVGSNDFVSSIDKETDLVSSVTQKCTRYQPKRLNTNWCSV